MTTNEATPLPVGQILDTFSSNDHDFFKNQFAKDSQVSWATDQTYVRNRLGPFGDSLCNDLITPDGRKTGKAFSRVQALFMAQDPLYFVPYSSENEQRLNASVSVINALIVRNAPHLVAQVISYTYGIALDKADELVKQNTFVQSDQFKKEILPKFDLFVDAVEDVNPKSKDAKQTNFQEAVIKIAKSIEQFSPHKEPSPQVVTRPLDDEEKARLSAIIIEEKLNLPTPTAFAEERNKTASDLGLFGEAAVKNPTGFNRVQMAIIGADPASFLPFSDENKKRLLEATQQVNATLMSLPEVLIPLVKYSTPGLMDDELARRRLKVPDLFARYRTQFLPQLDSLLDIAEKIGRPDTDDIPRLPLAKIVDKILTAMKERPVPASTASDIDLSNSVSLRWQYGKILGHEVSAADLASYPPDMNITSQQMAALSSLAARVEKSTAPPFYTIPKGQIEAALPPIVSRLKYDGHPHTQSNPVLVPSLEMVLGPERIKQILEKAMGPIIYAASNSVVVVSPIGTGLNPQERVHLKKIKGYDAGSMLYVKISKPNDHYTQALGNLMRDMEVVRDSHVSRLPGISEFAAATSEPYQLASGQVAMITQTLGLKWPSSEKYTKLTEEDHVRIFYQLLMLGQAQHYYGISYWDFGKESLAYRRETDGGVPHVVCVDFGFTKYLPADKTQKAAQIREDVANFAQYILSVDFLPHLPLEEQAQFRSLIDKMKKGEISTFMDAAATLDPEGKFAAEYEKITGKNPDFFELDLPLSSTELQIRIQQTLERSETGKGQGRAAIEYFPLGSRYGMRLGVFKTVDGDFTPNSFDLGYFERFLGKSANSRFSELMVSLTTDSQIRSVLPKIHGIGFSNKGELIYYKDLTEKERYTPGEILSIMLALSQKEREFRFRGEKPRIFTVVEEIPDEHLQRFIVSRNEPVPYKIGLIKFVSLMSTLIKQNLWIRDLDSQELGPFAWDGIGNIKVIDTSGTNLGKSEQQNPYAQIVEQLIKEKLNQLADESNRYKNPNYEVYLKEVAQRYIRARANELLVAPDKDQLLKVLQNASIDHFSEIPENEELRRVLGDIAKGKYDLSLDVGLDLLVEALKKSKAS